MERIVNFIKDTLYLDEINITSEHSFSFKILEDFWEINVVIHHNVEIAYLNKNDNHDDNFAIISLDKNYDIEPKYENLFFGDLAYMINKIVKEIFLPTPEFENEIILRNLREFCFGGNFENSENYEVTKDYNSQIVENLALGEEKTHELFNLLKENKAYISGSFITNLLTNCGNDDIDIFICCAPNKYEENDIYKFFLSGLIIENGVLYPEFSILNQIKIMYGDIKFNLIFINIGIYQDALDFIKTSFDTTCVMNYFDGQNIYYLPSTLLMKTNYNFNEPNLFGLVLLKLLINKIDRIKKYIIRGFYPENFYSFDEYLLK
jgi:hypothetical protein